MNKGLRHIATNDRMPASAIRFMVNTPPSPQVSNNQLFTKYLLKTKMKKLTVLKALVLSLMVAMCSVMPLHAQSDGFFKSDTGYEERDAVLNNSQVENQQFGNYSPLGSGLLIMVAVGTGYALARRRRSLRKIGTMLMALVMICTLTMCKKKPESIIQNNDHGVYITLTVQDDTRHHIVLEGEPEPGTNLGKVVWDDGDVIYVFSHAMPVGILQYDDDIKKFTGYIGEGAPMSYGDPIEGLPLCFVFTGNLFPDTDNYTLDIGNQQKKLAVMSMGYSDVYDPEIHDYSAYLNNKCALVKFTLNDETSDVVRIKNMVTKAQLVIDPINGVVDIQPTTTTGPLLLYNPNDEVTADRWAVIIPNNNTESSHDVMIGNQIYAGAVTIPAVVDNDLKFATINNTTITPTTSEPFFSVGDGRVVHIATGNLQYDMGNSAYRFAPNQYDIIGEDNLNVVNPEYAGIIDLFGWGTGDRPTLAELSDEPYRTFVDWGSCLNFNDGHNWHSIKRTDWYSIFNQASWDPVNDYQYMEPVSLVREGKSGPAKVCGVRGIVTLPDYFVFPQDLSLTPGTTGHWRDYEYNEYNAAQWALMEANGAIFMPISGQRYVINVESGWGYRDFQSDDDPRLRYWTSQTEDKTTYGITVRIDTNFDLSTHNIKDGRISSGLPVRLVYDVF